MSNDTTIYEVCTTCGLGKATSAEATADEALKTFRVHHLDHRLDIVPEQVFLSAYLSRGYHDVDRTNAEPIVTSFGGSTAEIGEKPMPYGAPESAKDAARKAREQRRGLLQGGNVLKKSLDVLSSMEVPAIIPPRTVQMRPSWDETFLRVAEVLSQRGTCSRLKVGAVLVKDTRIISTGYNGAPAGLRHCDHRDGGDMEDGHCSRAEHAERNALLLSRADARGATMYVTASPCLTCARMAVTVGVRKIVCSSDYRADARVDELCAAAGIELVALRLTDAS